MKTFKNLAAVELDSVEMAMLSGGDEPPPTTPTPPTPTVTLPTIPWGGPQGPGYPDRSAGPAGIQVPNATVGYPSAGGSGNNDMPIGLRQLLDSLGRIL